MTLVATKPIEQNLELTRTQEEINQGLQHFNSVKAVLEEMANSYRDLTIEGIDDKAGFKKVSEARKDLKAKRVELTKQGKSMRDGLTQINRFIKSKEDELVGIIAPVEEKLQEEENRIEAEKERIRLEAEVRERARIQARVDTLLQYGRQVDIAELTSLSDETFELLVAKAKEEFEVEQEEKRRKEEERLAEERRMEEERERLRKEHQALEEERRKIREEQEKIEAEKRAIEEAKASEERRRREEEEDKRRRAELEKEKKEAAERARQEAIAEQQRLEEERKAEEERKRIAAERKAARQPDKVKLQKYLNDLNAVAIPQMKTEDGNRVLKIIQVKLADLVSACNSFTEQM